MGVHDWRDILSRWLRSVYIWQGRFFRVITPCRGIRESFAAGTVDARDAANLFSPSLEISDDVRALLPLVLLRAKLFRRVRESRGRFIKVRISRAPRSIFLRSLIHRPCTTGSRAATKICRCAKNQKWTSRGPLKIRGEHPPRSPFGPCTISVDFLARSASPPVNDHFCTWYILTRTYKRGSVPLTQRDALARLTFVSWKNDGGFYRRETIITNIKKKCQNFTVRYLLETLFKFLQLQIKFVKINPWNINLSNLWLSRQMKNRSMNRVGTFFGRIAITIIGSESSLIRRRVFDRG